MGCHKPPYIDLGDCRSKNRVSSHFELIMLLRKHAKQSPSYFLSPTVNNPQKITTNDSRYHFLINSQIVTYFYCTQSLLSCGTSVQVDDNNKSQNKKYGPILPSIPITQHRSLANYNPCSPYLTFINYTNEQTKENYLSQAHT